jgi:hypothetical protein
MLLERIPFRVLDALEIRARRSCLEILYLFFQDAR